MNQLTFGGDYKTLLHQQMQAHIVKLNGNQNEMVDKSPEAIAKELRKKKMNESNRDLFRP